ncbi:MAG: serine/threonine protein kinase [Elusimicrobia bacterium]|nr:serine/threonine protein kinase [Elusimicrobiota bacterium]
MTVWAGALLLCAAAAGATEPAQPVERVHEELRALMGETTPLRDELAALAPAYADDARHAAAEVRRAELRPKLEALHARFLETEKEYEDYLRTHNMSLFSQGLARILSRPKNEAAADLTAMAGQELGGALALHEARRHVNAFRRRTAEVLEGDERAWLASVEARRERRRRRTVLSLAAALAVAAGIGWRLRRAGRAASIAPAEAGVPASGPRASGPANASAAVGGATSGGALLGGNYRLERELGRGGMGVVYEALDLSLQRKVAVKRLHPGLAARERDLEGFLTEARLVAGLKHPNIVEIHGILREGAEICLVFELVSGRSVDALIDARRRLPLEEARGVVRQAAAALDYAHERRIIHRDLTPGNIMVADSGLVKVMDFGLARQASVSTPGQSRAESWGTPPYMAPEQELGSVSRGADVFALGVCLYEMLTGRLPFEGPNYLAQKRERRYLPPSALAALGPGVDALLARALSPEASERFASAGELARALETA